MKNATKNATKKAAPTSKLKLNVRLSPDTMKGIQGMSKATKVSCSGVVRAACEHALKHCRTEVAKKAVRDNALVPCD